MVGSVALTLLVILIALAIAAYVLSKVLVREVIQETEFASLYRDGVFDRSLEAGSYWIVPFRDRIERTDKRPHVDVLSGQEILTKDRVAIKISLVLEYTPEDPRKIETASKNSFWTLLEAARLVLREAVADMDLDAVLEARSGLGDRVRGGLSDRAAELGFAMGPVSVRDIMLPGNLKRVYSGVLEAKKDAERRLEQARGDHAVMRSLANTAKMLDGNPSLAQARVLQALESGGNTIMFGAGTGVPTNGSGDKTG